MKNRPYMPDTLHRVYRIKSLDGDDIFADVETAGYSTKYPQIMFLDNLVDKIRCSNCLVDWNDVECILENNALFIDEFERI